jgi:serine/threonine protein kinase
VSVRSDKNVVTYASRCLIQLGMLLSVLGLLGTTGCSAGPSERSFPVPTWTADLPGRTTPLEVTLPTHLETLLPKGPADYVLRTKVVIPPEMQGRPLTLAIAHMPALATLTIDGNLAVPVDASTLDTYRATGPQRWRIPEDASKDGHLDLALHVSHRFVRSAWIDSVPEITTHPRGGSHLAAVATFNAVAATGALAAALFVAFFYAVLFVSLRDKRRAAYGWFALGALCGLPYPAFVLGLTQPLFGVYEGTFLTLALAAGSIAAMAFTRAYVGAPPPSKAWIGVLALAGIAAVLARDPFLSILVMGPVVVAITGANAVAQLLFLLRLRRENEHVPITIHAMAFAWPATVLLGLPDILAWLGQGEPSGGVRTACLGIMGISLYQALALSREHLVSLKRADDLVAELGDRVKLLQAKHREVEQLNDELRRQIGARSRELADQLSRAPGEELIAPPILEAGTVVENRYRVVKELGSGGMGTVYEVERVTDQKHFALKALGGGVDSQARARFAREAQIVANVNHPNVVSIVDVDVAKSGFIFLVMELIEQGTTLHDVRRRHRDVPWTLGVLAQVAEGLDAIHGAGIIHRDLKPGNILLSRGVDGRKPLVKITDFGISSLAPDGTRISAMERAAMVASSSVPDVSDLLDPFAVAALAVPALRISEIEKERTSERPPSGQKHSDSEVVTSARASLGLLDLESAPGPAPDASANVVTDSLPTERVEPVAMPAPQPSTPVPRSRAGKGSRTPSTPLTETGMIIGTPQYMAQELTTGTRNATRASDVFSLAIIAFEVLTGKRPFREAPVKAKLNGHPLPEPIPFRSMVPSLPVEIGELLDRALAHDPRVRPMAKELALALRDAAAKLSPP